MPDTLGTRANSSPDFSFFVVLNPFNGFFGHFWVSENLINSLFHFFSPLGRAKSIKISTTTTIKPPTTTTNTIALDDNSLRAKVRRCLFDHICNWPEFFFDFFFLPWKKIFVKYHQWCIETYKIRIWNKGHYSTIPSHLLKSWHDKWLVNTDKSFSKIKVGHKYKLKNE